MKPRAALYVTVGALRADPALQPGRRGARKLLVTEPRKGEYDAEDTVWHADPDKCPVQKMRDTELAVFTHLSWQDRHYHKQCTEIYIVMNGTMVIEAGKVNYPLAAGDMVVVNPRTVHEVKPSGTEFMCCVVATNCKGDKDKFVVPPGVVTAPADTPEEQ
jgi:mannose-6-phosphate isomerase-like protein (cupin superfamily)